MKTIEMICESCNRDRGALQKRHGYDRHVVWARCCTILRDRQTKLHPFKMRNATYGWLRIPAVLLGSVGLLGILAAQSDAVGSWLSFFNIPSVKASYMIVAGAATLLVLSFNVVKEAERNDVIRTVPARLHESWRSQ